MSVDCLDALVTTVEREHPHEALHVLARRVWRRLSADDRRAILLDLLADRLDMERRVRVRGIELQAERAAQETARREAREAERREAERRQAERAAQREAQRRERERLAEIDPRHAHHCSRRYREWVRTTPEGAAHDKQFRLDRERREHLAALSRQRTAEARAEGRRRYEEECEREERRREEYRRGCEEHGGHDGYTSWRLAQHLGRFAAKIQAETRLELTRELLGAEFALGDGRRVTWGEATAAQHAQRIELLFGNVHGNLATIKRHEAAVRLIAEHNVEHLSEIVREPVMA